MECNIHEKNNKERKQREGFQTSNCSASNTICPEYFTKNHNL